MRKLFAIFVFAMCLMLSGLVLTACSPDQIKEISAASGVETTIKVGTELDTSNIVITITYKSGKTETVDSSELTFSEIDTSVAGPKTLTITYGEYTFDVTINVTEEDPKNYIIMGFDDPSFITTWKANSKLQNTYTKTGSTGTKGFAVIDNPYLVGNDNAFVYAPRLHALYNNNTTADVKDYRATYKVYLHGTGEPSLLTGDTLESYVAINEVKHTLNFTDTAIDKTFTISVLPAAMTEEEAEDISASQFTFKVVDGYNVYTAADLSVLDNVNINGKWTALKQANGVYGIDTNAIILQSNITIFDKDIPSVHFYTAAEVQGDSDAERAVGSLKDTTDDTYGLDRVYSRKITSGSFTIEGNYYQISAQNISLIVREQGKITNEGESMTTHTCLFSFDGDPTGENITEYNINNVSLYGNTKKTENAALSGAILMMKKRNAKVNAYNNLVQCWFITYFNDEGRAAFDTSEIPLNINLCNAFDAYNTLIYNFGGVLNIEDSNLIGAGGPVMICDHVGNDKTTAEGGVISEVTTKNSVLESYVAGTEGWFNGYDGASDLAATIKAVDALFKPYGVTILDSIGEKMNLVAVYKSSEAEGTTDSNIRGSFAVADYDEEKAALIQKLETILNYILQNNLNPALTEDVKARVLASAEYVGLNMDITAVSYTECLKYLVKEGQIPSQEAADYIFSSTMAESNSLTKQELLTKLLALVGTGLENQAQAYGIYYLSWVYTMNYAREELATVLESLQTANLLTEEEVNKIKFYSKQTNMDAARNDIKTYLEIMIGLGQLSASNRDTLLSMSLDAQTTTGAFGFVGNPGWAISPNDASALTGATLSADSQYLYIHLYNGMSVIFTLSPYQAA